MAFNIGIFVFDDVEVLDFAGPYEVFTTATRMHARTHPAEPALFKVFTLGLTTAEVRARAGLNIYPDYDLSNHPTVDVLIVPGGVVTEQLKKTEVLAWIEAISGQSKITASVCTGAFLLAKAGLLDDQPATTHWEDIDDLRMMFPSLQIKTDVRWVDNGHIVTSGGISAGIDMSLHLVERLAGRALAQRTARQMEFDWTENS